jgi:hypothetical protein
MDRIEVCLHALVMCLGCVYPTMRVYLFETLHNAISQGVALLQAPHFKKRFARARVPQTELSSRGFPV